jgi:hypothetical protein
LSENVQDSSTVNQLLNIISNVAPNTKDSASVEDLFNGFNNIQNSAAFSTLNEKEFQETKFLTLKKSILGLATTLDDSYPENTIDNGNGLEAKCAHINNEDGDSTGATVTINGGITSISPAMFQGETSLSVIALTIKKSDVSSLPGSENLKGDAVESTMVLPDGTEKRVSGLTEYGFVNTISVLKSIALNEEPACGHYDETSQSFKFNDGCTHLLNDVPQIIELNSTHNQITCRCNHNTLFVGGVTRQRITIAFESASRLFVSFTILLLSALFIL